jgi:uncharacterized protein (DUF302 family)
MASLLGGFIMTRKILLAWAFLGLAALPLQAQDNGLRTIPATEDAAATLVKLEMAIKSVGMKVFTRIDHAAAAKEFGLTMPPSTVVIFGNPKNGTPNFLKKPTLAIDLPLKILVWQDNAGKTFITYNSASYVLGTLFERHGLKPPPEIIAEQEKMLESLAKSAAN